MADDPKMRLSLKSRPDARTRQMPGQAAGVADIDVGLRAYMLRVYNLMTLGLGITGAVAFSASTSDALMQTIYFTPLRWVVMLAPLGFAIFLGARLGAMRAATAQTVFWLFCGVMGLSLSYIFLAFTGASIARVFFITSGAFAALSLYGYTTKRDLSAWGSFLFMGLIGVVLASLVNLFLASSALHFAISVIGVLVFAGLTAYDTQAIKSMYLESDRGEVADKKAIFGALKLYLDFINMFVMLLHLFGNRE